jgi:hypothetical protein
MHFRQLLLSTLMVGAAIFFPENVFAEKNAASLQKGLEKSVKESVKVSVPEKVEQPKPLENKVPEHARVNQNEAKQLPSKDLPNQEAFKNLPDQAKGNVKPGLKKVEEENLKAAGHEKAIAVKKDKKILKDKSLPSADNEAAKSRKISSSDHSQGENARETEVESVANESNKIPANKKEIPKVSQMMNQTQRTNSSGGQSNDRASHGLSNINLLDKWFEWNYDFEIKLIQPYLSRQALLNTQWVNAPPAPPPQSAPLKINVTRS